MARFHMHRSSQPWAPVPLLLLSVACSSGGGSTPQAELFSGYGTPVLSVPVRLAITDQVPQNASATITGYTISPALPAGLSLDPSTGSISGAPTGLSVLRTYVVTATDGNANDSEEIRIEVRTPQVGLSTNRPLVASFSHSGTTVGPTGTGVGLTGVAPVVSVATITELDLPNDADETPVTNSNAQLTSSQGVPDLHNATADFTAVVTIDDAELSAEAWSYAVRAPYDDDGLTPGLPSFPFDTTTAILEDGQLQLDVSLPGSPVGTFPSAALPTSVLAIEPVTDVVDGLSNTWLPLGGAFYTIVEDAGTTEVHRFDPVGGVGGAPVLEKAFDLDAVANSGANIIGVIDGRLIVNLDDDGGISKNYSYDPGANELVQIANLRPGIDDNNDSFVALNGDLYFAGDDPGGFSRLHRYTYAAGGATATLEQISTTSEGVIDDSPRSLTPLGGMLYFSANDSGGFRNLYRFDPATSTQERLTAATNTSVNQLLAVGDALYVVTETSMNGQKLFVWDDTAGALVQLSDIQGDASVSDSIILMFGLGDVLYFSADNTNGANKMHRYTPATGEIEQVTDTAGATMDDNFGEALVLEDEILFVAENSNGNSKVWSLDRTTGETRQVIDLNGPGTSDDPCQLTAVGDGRVALELSEDATGYKLHLYDPADGFMYQAANINTTGGDDTFVLFVDAPRVYFSSQDDMGNLRAYVIE